MHHLDEENDPCRPATSSRPGLRVANDRKEPKEAVAHATAGGPRVEVPQAPSRQALEAQERERRRLARELHDEIGQSLTALGLTLELSTRCPPEAVRENLARARELVAELADQVRDLSLRLRPPMLDDLGLLPTLRWHLDRYTAHTGVRVDLHHVGLGRRFDAEVETAAYRIVQEALTNVARHAGVTAAAVTVWADRTTLRVRVEDRGRGFEAAAGPDGSSAGLVGMRERARGLGGRLLVISAPGAGTTLTAELPIADGAGGPDERDRRGRSDAGVHEGLCYPCL